jgi:aryl-alcohol dehydrogenase-like predicted oxidoreductase
LWGPTSFDECVATVHDAVAAGINLLDLAPRYGMARPRRSSAKPSAAVN